MEITVLAIFAGALFINSSSPGPSVAALVARVLTSGWRSVMPLLAAMWIGEALWLTAAVFGLSVMAQTFYWAFVDPEISRRGLSALSRLPDVDRTFRRQG